MIFTTIHYGYHPSEDHRDRLTRPMRPLSFPADHLPTAVNLRRWMTPVEQQLDINAW